MKILYITLENLSLHKGSVVHIKEVIDGLQRRGHQVGLIASAWGRPENIDHFYNINLKKLSPFKLLGPKRKLYLISSVLLFLYLFKVLWQYDIIYARDFHTVIIALLPRLLFRKKLVFEINGIANEEQRLKSHSILSNILAFFVKKAEKIATRWSDRIVSVTPQIATYLTHYFNCQPDKVNIISNGVNTKRFYPINDEGLLSILRKRLGIAKEDLVVVFAGNLAPWQGLENLIRVTPALTRQVENIRFLIIGDGTLKDKLIEQVNNLGISDHFVFTGMVDYQHIPTYINIGDICVLPKRRLKSGYSPLKLYEYMACGKPIISSRIEGLEFIESEEVGLLMEPEDIESFEKVLIELAKDPKRRKDMGQKASELARKKFDWELKLIEIEKILQRLA